MMLTYWFRAAAAVACGSGSSRIKATCHTYLHVLIPFLNTKTEFVNSWLVVLCKTYRFVVVMYLIIVLSVDINTHERLMHIKSITENVLRLSTIPGSVMFNYDT